METGLYDEATVPCWYCGLSLSPKHVVYVRSMKSGVQALSRAKSFWNAHKSRFNPKSGWTSSSPLCRLNRNCIYVAYREHTREGRGCHPYETTVTFSSVKPKARRPENDRYRTSQTATNCVISTLADMGIMPSIELYDTPISVIDICGSSLDNIAVMFSALPCVMSVLTNDVDCTLITNYNCDIKSETFVSDIQERLDSSQCSPVLAVVTSPPYKLVAEAIAASLVISRHVVAMKLPLNILEPTERNLLSLHLTQLKMVSVMCRSITGGEFGYCSRHFTDCWLIWRPESEHCLITPRISFYCANSEPLSNAKLPKLADICDEVRFPAADSKSCSMSSNCVEALLGVLHGAVGETVLARDDGDLLTTMQEHGYEISVLVDAEANVYPKESMDWVCLTPPKNYRDLLSTFTAALYVARQGVAMRVGLYSLEPNSRHSPLLQHEHLSDVIIMSRNTVTDVYHIHERYTTDAWLVWRKCHTSTIHGSARLHFCAGDGANMCAHGHEQK